MASIAGPIAILVMTGETEAEKTRDFIASLGKSRQLSGKYALDLGVSFEQKDLVLLISPKDL